MEEESGRSSPVCWVQPGKHQKDINGPDRRAVDSVVTNEVWLG
jgi:hypothetical protein